jgi:tRNA A-37 threonylcarbamoyl transferase component Bud32
MSLTLPQFAEALSASGLMTAEELSAFRARLPAGTDGEDAESLARELVRQGKLTTFQVNAVYQGKTRGLVFGEYVVLDKLGAGGMGRVFRARHRRMDRIVALKVLPREALDSAQAVERFEREVRAAARLLHPNIVAAYDAGVHEGIHYLVMEYVPGQDLGTLVREGGPLEIRQAIEYAIQAARGLHYAHGQGIVHRDIKPSNLLVSSGGVVKILDMGLARLDEGVYGDSKATRVEGLTRTGQVLGTIDYMAPEQAEDVNAADARSDVYGLGCTLYRLLTGRPPYLAQSLLRKLLAHREQPVPDLRELRPEAPPELAAVLQRMMAKLPEDRPASMGEVIELLEGVRGAQAPSIPQFAADGREPENEGLALDAELAGFFGQVEPRTAPQDGKRGIRRASARPAPRPRGTRRRSWVPAALVLALLAAAVPLAGVYWADRRPATLQFEWSPSERRDARLEIDAQPYDVPARGRVEHSVAPGQRRVLIRRRGFEPNEWRIELRPGQVERLTPRWVPAPVTGTPSPDDIRATRRVQPPPSGKSAMPAQPPAKSEQPSTGSKDPGFSPKS